MVEPPSWDDETNRWLAFLFGLKYERVVPPRGTNPDTAWQNYLNRVEKGLKAGYAIQTCRGWMGVKEEGGKITSKIGGRLFWWEGLSRRHRPNMHYFTLIGIDRAKDEIFFHDPIFGWFGFGKDVKVSGKILGNPATRTHHSHIS